jgi:hypothetical protein
MSDGEPPRRTTTRTSLLRTALRRLVLVAFCCAVVLIVLLVSRVALSITGSSFDPHGYTRIFGTVLAGMLTLVAMMLWALHRWLR